jgi:hypothetical protein
MTILAYQVSPAFRAKTAYPIIALIIFARVSKQVASVSLITIVMLAYSAITAQYVLVKYRLDRIVITRTLNASTGADVSTVFAHRSCLSIIHLSSKTKHRLTFAQQCMLLKYLNQLTICACLVRI